MPEGDYSEFESLDKDRLYQTLDHIERRSEYKLVIYHYKGEMFILMRYINNYRRNYEFI